MANVLKFLKYLDRLVLGLLKGIALGAFGLISLLILAGIFVRFIPVASLHWFDEILELLFAYMVFYGAAALWITGGHFSVGDWIKRRLFKHEAGRHFYQMLVDLIVLFFVVVFFLYSYHLTRLTAAVTNAFAIPKRVLYSCLPVSGAFMIIYSLRNIVVEFLGMVGVRQPADERTSIAAD